MEAIDWAVASAPIPGEQESGDAFVVKISPSGTILAAVVDGLGHGGQAHEAARTAISTLEAHAGEQPASLLKRCHDAMRHTRGAAISLAVLNPGTGILNWAGIGNVDAQLFRADAIKKRESILHQGGVVGYQIPPLRESAVSIGPGDVLVFATDGIRNDFVNGVEPAKTPQTIADAIFASYYKGTDDGLVLVVLYTGNRQ